MRLRFLLILTCCAMSLNAQLIPAGSPIPKTPKPPVVFLNGYQSSCSGSQFANTFGKFDQILQAAGRVSLFFDNCTLSGKPAIEDLGNGFGDYLAALRYTDQSPVTQVDIVAHSMGGLIVRSYLAGKQTAGAYQPPANPPIRKIVFLSTPNFGTPIGSLFGLDIQTTELANGSNFTFDLATWNQGTDDLRGIDSLALAGNGGTGRAVMAGFDDGVVSLSSSSIGFAKPGRTRVIPYCHTGPGLVTIAGLCGPNAPGIALGVNAMDSNAAAVVSFLNDTNDWQTIGQAPEQNPLLSIGGGLVARAKSPGDQFLTIQKAAASKDLNILSNAVAWTEYLPAGTQSLMLTTPSGILQTTFSLPPGFVTAKTVKNGPFIARVLPSAAVVSPLAVAPGTFVAIYGSGLAAAAQQANSLPFPTSLGGVTVSAGGTAAALQFVSPTQINAIIPSSVQGLVKVTVTNGSGSHTVNVLIQPAVPAIYTLDQSGTGAAAALNALTGTVVGPGAPLHAGDFVSIYLTGLGTVHSQNGLQVADLVPSVTVGAKPCTVTYAGRAPGFDGLDQINCQLAADVGPNAGAPVAVISGARSSNQATLAIQ